jgi:hypothetical protein
MVAAAGRIFTTREGEPRRNEARVAKLGEVKRTPSDAYGCCEGRESGTGTLEL